MAPYFTKVSLIVFYWILFCVLFLFMAYIRLPGNQSTPVSGLANGRLRQEGDYWVWQDFIRRSANLSGNQSITLTTHATHGELSLLPDLLHRWQAPISVAIFASGAGDYEMTIEALRSLYKCPKHNALMLRFISVHLVVRDRQTAELLNHFNSSVKLDPWACEAPPIGAARPNRTQDLSYPVNLLRNVARTNAPTYFILALDMQVLPTTNFVNKFLSRFVWKPSLAASHKTIFCMAGILPDFKAPSAKPQQQVLDVVPNLTKPIFNVSALQTKTKTPQVG